MQGTVGTATASSETITDLSVLTFTINSITPYGGTGTQERPAIAENGNITTTATTTAGSYRVTITPDGSTYAGDPLTVDFYVTIKPADIAALDTALQAAITNYGRTGDFNYIDTSAITTMAHLFRSGYTPGTGAEDTTRTYVEGFNGDISKWDISIVENFTAMFYGATAFNQDIGGWNVSSGTNFSYMFYGATAFNQNIGNWNVSSGKDFSGMFSGATAFNQDIGEWVVSSGTSFAGMFQGAVAFNQDISGWNVAKGTNFNQMFQGATTFNQDLSSWNLASTVTKTDMFLDSGVTSPPAWYQ